MDRVRVVQSAGSWTQVEALDQPMVYNGTWSGYIGWVESAQLATATALVRLPTPTHSVVVPYTHLMPDRPTFPLPSWLPNETLPDLSYALGEVCWRVSAHHSSLVLAPGWRPRALRVRAGCQWQCTTRLIRRRLSSASTVRGRATVSSCPHGCDAHSLAGWVLARDVAVFVQSTDEATIRALLPQRAEHLLGYPCGAVDGWGMCCTHAPGVATFGVGGLLSISICSALGAN